MARKKHKVRRSRGRLGKVIQFLCIVAVLAAMTVVECGIRPEKVDMEAIKQGYTLAFGEPYPNEGDTVPAKENVVWDEYWDWSPMAYGK